MTASISMALENEQPHISAGLDYQLADVNRLDLTGNDVSRVLMIYTGGTIGMKHTSEGYQPAENFLTETLASQTRFHDPNGISVFGQTSRAASPTGSNSSKGLNSSRAPSPDQRLDVKIERYPSNRIKRRDGTIVHIRSLITPPSLYGKRIRYSVLEYDPLLDSSNISREEWVQIATDIELNYKLYDAFIVIHGTDTMANTASAMSFLLEDLGKTVIVCGSQVPLSELRNDAVENLLGALTIAGHFVIPEVGLYFANRLFRGNRVTKMSAVDFDAFDSPNLRPLVDVGINIDVHWNKILRASSNGSFQVHKSLHPNVTILRLFPGIPDAVMHGIFTPGMHVVLETFGAGNVPKSECLMKCLEESYKNNIVVVNCTQCKKGTVSDIYASGRQLVKFGVIPGGDMTTECAIVKLSYLLSKYKDIDIVRKLMVKSLRGELTVTPIKTKFSHQHGMNSMVSSTMLLLSNASLSGLSEEERNIAERQIYPTLICSTAGNGDLQGLISLHNRLKSGLSDAITSELGDDIVFLNCHDYNGYTPLHLAAKEGHISIIQYLLSQGANVHAKSDRRNISNNNNEQCSVINGVSALFLACVYGNLQIVDLLKSAGAYLSDLGSPSELENGWIYVTWAIREGSKDHKNFKIPIKLSCWIKAGWNLQYRGWDGKTCLHIAVTEGNINLVKYILNSISDVKKMINVEDKFGMSVINEAKRMVEISLNQDIGTYKEIYHIIQQHIR